MTRSGLLAIVVVLFGSLPSHAQFGGMGGMGGGMGGMPRGMGPGMMPGMRGMMGGEEWTVKVAMEGDRTVTGKLALFAVVVDSDLGQYLIKPEKVKSIEISKGAKLTSTQEGSEIPATVVTSGDEKVTGLLHIPSYWQLEIELGTLRPDPKKMRTITFLSGPKSPDMTRTGTAAPKR